MIIPSKPAAAPGWTSKSPKTNKRAVPITAAAPNGFNLSWYRLSMHRSTYAGIERLVSYPLLPKDRCVAIGHSQLFKHCVAIVVLLHQLAWHYKKHLLVCRQAGHPAGQPFVGFCDTGTYSVLVIFPMIKTSVHIHFQQMFLMILEDPHDMRLLTGTFPASSCSGLMPAPRWSWTNGWFCKGNQCEIFMDHIYVYGYYSMITHWYMDDNNI